jgi:hypothetical protein
VGVAEAGNALAERAGIGVHALSILYKCSTCRIQYLTRSVR